MKQLTWTPSSIAFGNKKKGETVTGESTLSIPTGAALLTPGKIFPLPNSGYPVQIKNTTGNLHIHPAFIFEAGRQYLTSAGVITTNRDIAELYLGIATEGVGMPFLPVPITLAITTPAGNVDPLVPFTITYTSSAILWIKVEYRINGGDWDTYNTFNATGSFEMDLSDVSFTHGDTLTIRVTDDMSASFSDSVDLTVILASIEITSLNSGVNLELTGIYTEGTRYFYGTNGAIVEGDDPNATDLYYGTGNADGMIDVNPALLEILMCIGDLSIVNVPDTIPLDAPTTVTWSADTLETVNIYADEVLVGDGIDATLETYDITLLSTDFSVGDTPVISFRSVSGVVLDSEEVEVIT